MSQLYGAGEPPTVQQATLVRFGHEIFGLVVVAVCRLHRPQVHRHPVPGQHDPWQKLAVAGDQNDVAARPVASQINQMRVDGCIDAFLL